MRRYPYRNWRTASSEQQQIWIEEDKELQRIKAKQWRTFYLQTQPDFQERENARSRQQYAEKDKQGLLDIYRKKKAAAKRKRYETDEEFRLRSLQQTQQYRLLNPEVKRRAMRKRTAMKANVEINDFTDSEWQWLLQIYDSCCVYCGQQYDNLTRDHIIPYQYGGNNTWSNIVPACISCNSHKNAGLPQQLSILTEMHEQTMKLWYVIWTVPYPWERR